MAHQVNKLRFLSVINAYFIAFILLFPVFSIQKSSFAKNEEQSSYLTCRILKTRTNEFLEYHYLFRSFDEELSRRTFLNYLKFLDPGKLFFLQSDIDTLSKYKNLIGKKINASDCAFIAEIYDLYLKRVDEGLTYAKTALNQKIDFTIDEYIETDRKKIEWAQSSTELQDRWRKTVKFVLLNMKEQDKFSKIVERVKKRYELLKKDINSRTQDEINSIFLNAFALSLDPHSSFLTPVDNAQFQIDFSLKLVGIGATLVSPDGYTTIDAIVPGGAAARDGRLKKGDKIIAVDAGDGTGLQDVIDMNLNKVVQLVRGKEGTFVTLVILRKDASGSLQRIQLKMKRAIVEIKENEAKSDVMKIGAKKIGVINLPSFYIDYKECQSHPASCRSSANDMLREIKKLSKQNVDGIVIDLRHNGGGDLTEAERIVSFFITNPVVTQVEDKDSVIHRLEVNSRAVYNGPLSVLISRYTASASEIFAGAVQDYGRGLIVGDSRTFGKGTVQTVIDIPGTANRQTNGAIHVTIAKFFRPSGKSNQEKGVASDVVISNPVDFYSIGESDYDYVLPYTTIKPAPNFRPYQSFTPFVPQLQTMSQARLAKLPNYKDIQDAINKAQEKQNTLVSLKEIPVKKSQKSDTTDLDDDNPFKPQVVISEKDYELKEAAQILLDSTKLIGQTNWETDHS